MSLIRWLLLNCSWTWLTRPVWRETRKKAMKSNETAEFRKSELLLISDLLHASGYFPGQWVQSRKWGTRCEAHTGISERLDAILNWIEQFNFKLSCSQWNACVRQFSSVNIQWPELRHTCARARTHTHAHTYIHTHKHTNTQTHAHTHTQTHTHTQDLV